MRGKGDPAEDKLRAKCDWEHMTRTGVLKVWGHQDDWK